MGKSMYGASVPTLREVIPSPEEVSLTRALVEAGKILDRTSLQMKNLDRSLSNGKDLAAPGGQK
jgi:hypothetical protein